MPLVDPRIPIPQDAVMAEVKRELDALRAEYERLSEANASLQLSIENLRSLLAQSPHAEIERLRAALEEIASLTSDMATGVTATVYVKANHALDTSSALVRPKRA